MYNAVSTTLGEIWYLKVRLELETFETFKKNSTGGENAVLTTVPENFLTTLPENFCQKAASFSLNVRK